jgi:hypothetical protein
MSRIVADWGHAALYTGFLALDILTVGESSVATTLVEKGLLAAGREAAGNVAMLAGRKIGEQLTVEASEQLAQAAWKSLASSTIKGIAIGEGVGAVIGGITGYAQNGWQGAVQGASQGALNGALIGGLNGAAFWLVNPTCFVAGTQVVVEMEYLDEEGNVDRVTARRLSQIGRERRLATLEAMRLRGTRYTTCPIELLKAGDWVLTRDESDAEGELVLRQVEETFVRTAFRLQIITLRSSSGVEQTLQTTAEHPVYAMGKGWIASGEIQPGDQLAEPGGGTTTILASRKEIHRKGITVYNFRVQESHTYFVREAGSQAEPVWVHNAGAKYYTDVRQWRDPETGQFISVEAAADCFALATLARDSELARLATLSKNQQKAVSAVVGGINVETGATAVGVKISGQNFGMCAEDLVVDALGGDPAKVLMSAAIRPRTNELVPVCLRCQTNYVSSQFAPGTLFG